VSFLFLALETSSFVPMQLTMFYYFRTCIGNAFEVHISFMRVILFIVHGIGSLVRWLVVGFTLKVLPT
jgi:hypothetical protein